MFTNPLLVTALASLLAISSLSQAESNDPIIVKLTEWQPLGWDSPVIIDVAEGVLLGEVNSTAILYGYQIGSERDRNGWQYLTVKTGDHFANPIQVGGGFQFYSEVLIKNQTIHLKGKRRATGASMADLSQAIELEYVLSNRKLMALGRDS